jgi:hypothetical protein
MKTRCTPNFNISSATMKIIVFFVLRFDYLSNFKQYLAEIETMKAIQFLGED